MTPREYYDLVEGWNWRRKFKEETEAKYVTILANSGGNLKRRLRIEDVLGRNTMSKKEEIAARRKELERRKKNKEEE